MRRAQGTNVGQGSKQEAERCTMGPQRNSTATCRLYFDSTFLKYRCPAVLWRGVLLAISNYCSDCSGVGRWRRVADSPITTDWDVAYYFEAPSSGAHYWCTQSNIVRFGAWTGFGSGGAQCGWSSDPAKNRAKYWQDIRRFFTQILHEQIILYSNRNFFFSHLPLGNQSVSQKVYLKFGRGIAKISEKSLTVRKDFVILKFGHKHFIHFYFSDGPLS